MVAQLGEVARTQSITGGITGLAHAIEPGTRWRSRRGGGRCESARVFLQNPIVHRRQQTHVRVGVAVAVGVAGSTMYEYIPDECQSMRAAGHGWSRSTRGHARMRVKCNRGTITGLRARMQATYA